MSTAEHKDVVRRFYAEVINGRDLVAAHQRWSGTHVGEFAGIAATGRRVEFLSTAILRIADGMIAEAVDVVASGELVAQLTAP